MSSGQHTAKKRSITKALRDAGWLVTPYSGSAGVADLICCTSGGQYIEVEVKTGKADLTKGQRIRQQRVETRGGIHVVLREAAEAREFAENWSRVRR